MRLAHVVGRIWATKKADNLSPYKLLLVKDENSGELITAVDVLDAGEGERVVITNGSSARRDEIDINLPIDATVIAIVDDKK